MSNFDKQYLLIQTSSTRIYILKGLNTGEFKWAILTNSTFSDLFKIAGLWLCTNCSKNLSSLFYWKRSRECEENLIPHSIQRIESNFLSPCIVQIWSLKSEIRGKLICCVPIFWSQIFSGNSLKFIKIGSSASHSLVGQWTEAQKYQLSNLFHFIFHFPKILKFTWGKNTEITRFKTLVFCPSFIFSKVFH